MSTVDTNISVESCEQCGQALRARGTLPEEAKRQAERLALVGTLLVGIGKCVCIGALALIWMVIGDELGRLQFRNGTRIEDMLGYMAAAAISAAVGQAILSHFRWRILAGTVFMAGLLMWALFWFTPQWLLYREYQSVHPSDPIAWIRAVSLIAIYILAGGVGGSIVHSLIWKYWARCSPWGLPGLANVGLRGARFCRGCGEPLDEAMPSPCRCGDEVLVCRKCQMATPAGGYSGAVAGAIATMESAMAMFCEVMRSLVVMAAGLVCFFWGFSFESAHIDSLEMAVWLIAAGVTGGILAITTLPWKSKFKAAAAILALVCVCCVCGSVVKTVGSGGMPYHFERDGIVLGIGAAGALAGWCVANLMAPPVLKVLLPKYLHRHLLRTPGAAVRPEVV